MKHTSISNNNGAFASVVNECERTRDLSSLFQVFFFVCVCVCSSRRLTHSVEKYPATLNIVVFDLHESPYMTSDPARTFMHS